MYTTPERLGIKTPEEDDHTRLWDLWDEVNESTVAAIRRQTMFTLSRNYTTGQPINPGATWTDAAALTVPNLLPGQQILLTVQATIDQEVATEQTALLTGQSTGATWTPQVLTPDRFPPTPASRAIRTAQRVMAFTADGGDATFRIRIQCGTGANRLLAMSGQLFAQVSA